MAETVEVAGDVVVDGLNITERLAEIEDQGYTIIPDFITPDEIARIRHAFDTEVRITVARGLGVSGRTWRAHNLLAKTRAVDYLFLDSRVRALVEGVLGKYTQINVTTLFNVPRREAADPASGRRALADPPTAHFLCNALIALDDFDLENGVTHIVPYSHRWHDRPIDQDIETTQVTLRPGTMLMGRRTLARRRRE